MEHIKMEYPNFIKVKMFVKDKDDKDMLGELRINPVCISSYYEGFHGDTDKRVTVIYVAGNRYLLDMTIEEVDEMMENIDRGMSIKE